MCLKINLTFPFSCFFFNTEWLDGNLSKLQPVHNRQTGRTGERLVCCIIQVPCVRRFMMFWQMFGSRRPKSFEKGRCIIVSLNLFIGWLNAVRRQKESCFESLITVTIRVTRGRTWKEKKGLIDFTKLLKFIHMNLNLIVLLVLVWNDLWQTNAWHQSCVCYWQYRWLYPSSWWHFKGERVTTRLFEQLSRMTRLTNHGL